MAETGVVFELDETAIRPVASGGHAPAEHQDSPVIAWKYLDRETYYILVYLFAEDGNVTALAAHLPGLASQGRTEEKALDNLAEAFRGLLESYRAAEQPVPWQETPIEAPEEDFTKGWITVENA